MLTSNMYLTLIKFTFYFAYDLYDMTVLNYVIRNILAPFERSERQTSVVVVKHQKLRYFRLQTGSFEATKSLSLKAELLVTRAFQCSCKYVENITRGCNVTFSRRFPHFRSNKCRGWVNSTNFSKVPIHRCDHLTLGKLLYAREASTIPLASWLRGNFGQKLQNPPKMSHIQVGLYYDENRKKQITMKGATELTQTDINVSRYRFRSAVIFVFGQLLLLLSY